MVNDFNIIRQRMAGKIEERADGARMAGVNCREATSKDWIFFRGGFAQIRNYKGSINRNLAYINQTALSASAYQNGFILRHQRRRGFLYRCGNR